MQEWPLRPIFDRSKPVRNWGHLLKHVIPCADRRCAGRCGGEQGQNKGFRLNFHENHQINVACLTTGAHIALWVCGRWQQ